MKKYIYILHSHKWLSDNEEEMRFRHEIVEANSPEEAYDKGAKLIPFDSGAQHSDYVIELPN